MSDELDFLADDDAAAIDRYVGKLAREEQDDLHRDHGQAILDAVADHQRRRQGSAEDPLLKAIEAAYRAKAQEDNQL